ncbi:MAG: hypothetical protein QNJ72_08075 [Pleurocapsa sp. MO_226.B13]|nr:hypothetical protein [Pleurocapsa sp. MO_226.B13]
MDIQDKIPIPIKLSQFIALGVITAMLAVATPLAAQETQAIAIDGSSTVYPITQKIVEEYQTSQKKPRQNLESKLLPLNNKCRTPGRLNLFKIY